MRSGLPAGVTLILAFLVSCGPSDREAPAILEVRVNGNTGEYVHGAGGQTTLVDVRCTDDKALWQARIEVTGAPGHHEHEGVVEVFRYPLLGSFEWLEVQEVEGTEDQPGFRVDIPWQVSGPHALEVSVMDEEGRMSYSHHWLMVESDSLPVVNPDQGNIPVGSDGALLLASGTDWQLGGYALDPDGLASVRIRILSASGEFIWIQEEVLQAQPVFQLSQMNLPVPVSPGFYELEVWARDTRGHAHWRSATLRVE